MKILSRPPENGIQTTKQGESALPEKPKILIITGYHPDETLAVQVGEIIFRRTSNPRIETVRYAGKADKNESTRNLRKSVEGFNPIFSVIIHSDDNLETNALIFYRRKAGERMENIKNLLLTFVHRYDKGRPLVFFGISDVRGNAKRTLIDLELGSEMEPEEAVCLIENFAQYLVGRS